MESTATYDFIASAEDELSFSKGDTLKVLYLCWSQCFNSKLLF